MRMPFDAVSGLVNALEKHCVVLEDACDFRQFELKVRDKDGSVISLLREISDDLSCIDIEVDGEIAHITVAIEHVEEVVKALIWRLQ